MIFGDRDDFAIEAEVEPCLSPPSAVWGRMCIWCRGIRLGDFEATFCAHYPASIEFTWLSEHLDELWDGLLADLDDQLALDYLDGLLYGYHGEVEIEDSRTLAEMRADWDRFGKFNFLTNWGEQFDGYKSFILCPPNGPIRILSRHLPVSSGFSVPVSKRGFLDASHDFMCWFNEQVDRLT